MTRYQQSVFRGMNIAVDSLLIALAMILAYYSRVFMTAAIQYGYSARLDDYLQFSLVVVPLWNLLFYLQGLYPVNRLRSFREVAWIILKVNYTGILICAVMLYIFKLHFMGRIALVLFGLYASALMVAKEVMVRKAIGRARENKHALNNVLIIGDNGLVAKIVDKIEQNPYLGMHIAGIYLLDKDVCEDSPKGIKCMDRKRDIRLLLLEHHIDNVIVAVGKEKLSETEEILLKCEEFGAEIWLYADFFELMFAQKEIDVLDDMPFLVFRTTPPVSWAMLAKRFTDVVGALVLLVLMAPVFLFAAAGIKITSPGPVIFRQKRIGLHGRKFVLFKLRSMSTDAEQRKEELLARNMMAGPVFKVKNDPRITPFGRFLRRASIDELPQLWNVLMGDMSLVGPRPPLPKEVNEYRGWQRRRLSMRPGITCLWQVGGRNRITDFDQWTKLDLRYIDNWSLWLDARILLKTVFVVLFRIGAE